MRRRFWKHLEPAISRLNNGDLNPVPAVPTMGDLAKKYKREYLPKLAKSTQDTDISMIDVHIVPRWGQVKLANIRPPEVESWIESLDLSSSSRGRARRTTKQMFDRAMFWGLLPLGVNPMTLAKTEVRALTARGYADLCVMEEAKLWFRKGLSHREVGEFDKAFDCFNKAIRLRPHDAEIQKAIALSY
jgi:tetratricopeptide (TPR) repeat protein